MAFLWLLPIFTFIKDGSGSGAPAGDPGLSIMPRIINGTDAHPGAWPWHVSLQSSTGVHFCGGSLINRNWVITAAHCNVTAPDLVVAGHHDRRFSQDDIQTLKIAQIFVHPKFCMHTMHNDIALVKLATPARVHETVSPVVLPTADEKFLLGSQCRTMGWGLTHPNGEGVPDKLQQATVHLLPSNKCRMRWGPLSRDMICVGVNGAGSYLGDSGSSVVCIKYGVWTLVGIVSLVHKDKPTVMPFVATRFPRFKPWVQKTMAEN